MPAPRARVTLVFFRESVLVIVVAVGGSVVALFGLFGAGGESRIRNIGTGGTASTLATTVSSS